MYNYTECSQCIWYDSVLCIFVVCLWLLNIKSDTNTNPFLTMDSLGIVITADLFWPLAKLLKIHWSQHIWCWCHIQSSISCEVSPTTFLWNVQLGIMTKPVIYMVSIYYFYRSAKFVLFILSVDLYCFLQFLPIFLDYFQFIVIFML